MRKGILFKYLCWCILFVILINVCRKKIALINVYFTLEKFQNDSSFRCLDMNSMTHRCLGMTYIMYAEVSNFFNLRLPLEFFSNFFIS